MAATLKRLFSGVAPIVLLFVLLLASLYLMSSATQNSEQFSRLYIPMLLVNGLELLILTGLIGVNLGRLVRQYRNKATGSRLTVRLVVLFVLLAVVPVSTLYYFSLNFIRHGIDSWFDVRVERALNDALNLSRTTLDWHMRGLLRQTEQLAEGINQVPQEELLLWFNEQRYQLGASEAALLRRDGTLLAFASDDANSLSPLPVDRVIISQLENGLSYVGLDSGLGAADALVARLVVNVASLDLENEPRVLQLLFPAPEGINALTESVQSAFAEHEQLAFLSGPLKLSFTVALSLVLLLSLFTAVWVAFYLAQRLVAPIRVLAIGTRAVSSGDYHRRLPVTSVVNDELGFLVRSFNTMMGRIAEAQAEADKSRSDMENQKIYLETVLGHLSSGVVTFNKTRELRTVNAAAEQILGIQSADCLGMTPELMSVSYEHLQEFSEMLVQHFVEESVAWQEQAIVFGAEGRQLLMCRGDVLPGRRQLDSGYVVVFDDVTTLIRAQRDAAWGEVARRLAHEIKNPLTPIQLSAERLRHKYLPMLATDDADLLDRSTHTIVQQVETMKKMVKAFSDYARTPKLELATINLNEIVCDVLDLYHDEKTVAEIEVKLDPRIDSMDADSDRVRQLMHNLIKNALEAAAENLHPVVKVQTRLVESHERQAVELIVEDNGSGIGEGLMDKLFEPYVSSKPKGSGLGLAIVKKIVEEHNGLIWAHNLDSGGARLTIRLPLHLSARMLQQDQDEEAQV